MRATLAAALFLASSFSHAVVLVGDCPGFAWDYSGEDEALIDGFEMILDGTPGARVDAAERSLTCADAQLTDGDHTLAVRAYQGLRRSGNSNVLTFTYQTTAAALPTPSPVIMLFGVGGPSQNMALQFDGVDDFFDAGQPRVSGSAISITAAVKVASFAAPNHWGRIISQATGTADHTHWWMVSLANASFRYRLKAGGVTTTLIGSGSLVAGQWHHVAATYDGANMRLYQDGQEVGSVAKTGSLDVADESVATYIGRNPGDTNSFKGLIDDVTIYSSALSPAQVAAVAAGEEVPGAALIANWDFEEGSPGEVAVGGPVYIEAD
jgi:hypothetical protein